MTGDTVERLYLRLVEALTRTRRDGFAAPVTVAEIYQELVPYRLVRGEVGFDMNADYEHALLRLLSGEGEHARLEPQHAREHIVRELKSPNPNVSIYREFAGCDVWIAPPSPGLFDPASTVRDVLDDDDESAADPWSSLPLIDDDEDMVEDAVTFALVDAEPAEAEQPSPADRPTEDAPPPRFAARAQPAEPHPTPSAAGDTAERMSCAYCDSPLPAHRPVRYCPYCGHDQTMTPCASCGEPIEAGWLFCVSCGTARDAV